MMASLQALNTACKKSINIEKFWRISEDFLELKHNAASIRTPSFDHQSDFQKTNKKVTLIWNDPTLRNFFIHTPSNDKIQLEMVMGLQNKHNQLNLKFTMEIHHVFLPVIKRWWLACKSNFRYKEWQDSSTLLVFSALLKPSSSSTEGSNQASFFFPPLLGADTSCLALWRNWLKRKTPASL